MAWHQAITGGSRFEQNVVFNVPHTAWHANDGAYGGDELVGNLLFNVNRETTAHGVMNSYERQPYINDQGMLRDKESNPMPTVAELDAGATPGYKLAPPGTPTTISRYRRVHRNMFVANYYSMGPYYTDDGTSRVLMWNNYNVLGYGTMSPHLNSEWIYNVGCINAYQVDLMNNGGAKWHLYFYNTTVLSRTAKWCKINGPVISNVTFKALRIYTPGGGDEGNQACSHPGPIAVANNVSMGRLRSMAAATLAPYPRPYQAPS